MSANTTVYVKILRTIEDLREDIIEVSAVTRSEAEEIAKRQPGVIQILGSAYEPYSIE